jgi:hypothetical protein
MQPTSALQINEENNPFKKRRQHFIAAKKEKQDYIPASLKIYKGEKLIKSSRPIERFLPLRQ